MSSDFERLVGRAVADKEFRDKLLADPEGTIKDSDLKLSEEEVVGLEAGINQFKIDVTSQQLDQNFARGSWH